MYPKTVTVCDVGPRDGLQTEKVPVTTAQKIQLVDALAAAGVPEIEACSFVHPGYVPQMADAEAVMAGITRRPGTRYRGLVPNHKGAERARQVPLERVSVVLAVSETFNAKNSRMSVAESVRQCTAIFESYQGSATQVSCVLATAFGCPYEGEVSAARVLAIVGDLWAAGVRSVSLADTTGMAVPPQVFDLCSRVYHRFPEVNLSLHFHNTRGLGLANVLAGMEAGVTGFDASLGGLGGCPYAPKATGNICSEDLVHMCREMGIDTGIDLDALIAAANWLEGILGRPLPGLVMHAGDRWVKAPV